jgi:quercetin dioxygenase-like cupin family protein
MVYVLSGAIEVLRKGQLHQLGTRDVMYISGETPRTYRCHSDDPASILVISFDNETADIPRLRRRIPPSVA